MVAFTFRAMLAFTLAVGPGQTPLPTVMDAPVMLISSPVLITKPCEPVYILLEVDTSRLNRWAEIKSIASEFEERVIVNGADFNKAMIGNPVAAFVFDEEWFKSQAKLPSTVSILGILYINFDSGRCLFEEPGEYEIELKGALRFLVQVEDVDQADREVLARLQEAEKSAKWWFAMGMDPDPTTIHMAERILSRYPATYYEKLLGPSLAISRVVAARQAMVGGTPKETGDRLKEQAAEARRLLGPYVQKTIRSPLTSLAYYHLAEALQDNIHWVERTTGVRQSIDRAEVKRLFEAVRDSDYSILFRKRARDSLAQLAEDE